MSNQIIGRAYYATLELVKNYLTSLANGGMSENIELVREGNRARCYYDGCCKRREPCDTRITLSFPMHSRGEEQNSSRGCSGLAEPDKVLQTSLFFHAECLEKLVQDKRLQSLS
ncbi:hypothetical protein D6817_04035 [Candidatus Pacearchaeota archaeon]|nr:MAG: hypothetical protein D6817_04035 [Candidatus Pacearchaeota archaeon]